MKPHRISQAAYHRLVLQTPSPSKQEQAHHHRHRPKCATAIKPSSDFTCRWLARELPAGAMHSLSSAQATHLQTRTLRALVLIATPQKDGIRCVTWLDLTRKQFFGPYLFISSCTFPFPISNDSTAPFSIGRSYTSGDDSLSRVCECVHSCSVPLDATVTKPDSLVSSKSVSRGLLMTLPASSHRTMQPSLPPTVEEAILATWCQFSTTIFVTRKAKAKSQNRVSNSRLPPYLVECQHFPSIRPFLQRSVGGVLGEFKLVELDVDISHPPMAALKKGCHLIPLVLV